MTKKDVLELKRRFKKNECTFTKMCGCYVNAHKEIVVRLNETFLNLEDEEFYKYLEIAQKSLSGTIGNNLLELEFPTAEEHTGGRQQFLMGLKDSKLKNEDLLERFYQLIIDSYDYVGNFLILLFHDAYDVITKTNDNAKLDESEEVYEYLLCAICPVELTKPGLGYREDEHRIGARIRDWVVSAPENGFLFPAFTDRSSDIHSLVYYTKNAKETHPELMENGLGCTSKQTATEQKETFQSIIKKAAGENEEKSEALFLDIQENLNEMIEETEDLPAKDSTPLLLTPDTVTSLMTEIGIPKEITAQIEQSFKEEFGDTPPVIEHLIDNKALAVNAQRKKEQALVEQVEILKQQLEEKSNPEIPIIDTTDLQDTTEQNDSDTCDVVLKVAPEKVAQITSQIIDGKKCLIIPLEDDELANVNGQLTDL